MRHTLCTTLAVLLISSTAWSYSIDVPSKTVTSTGTLSDVNGAGDHIRDQEEDGWTLIIGTAGGSYTWATATSPGYADFTFTHSTTVKGASPTNRPTITHGVICSWAYGTGKLLTVKDLIFSVTEARSGPWNAIAGSGPNPGFRFTNVRWEAALPGQLFTIGTAGGNPGTSEEGPYGLFDNCDFVGEPQIYIYCNNGSGNELAVSPSWRRPMAWGTTKAVYFEQCDFSNPSGVISGYTPTDSFNGGSLVFRHNRMENIMLANHGADHYANAVKGGLKHEIYQNEFHVTNGTNNWMVYLRGGAAVIFDNEFYATDDGTATQAIYWDYYRANSGAGPANSIYDRFYSPLSTTIAAGSNGQSLGSAPRTVHVSDTTAFLAGDLAGPVYTSIASGSNGVNLPQGTINVADTTDFPSSGYLKIGTPDQVGTYGDAGTVAYTGKTSTSFTGCTTPYGSTRLMTTGDIVAGADVLSKFAIYIENIKITTSAGIQTVSATGKTATTFTGVRGGTGTMSTGGAVTRASDYVGTQQPGSGTITALVAAGSNGASLPQGTIHVDSTINFPSSGTLLVNYDWTDGTGQTVTYTGKTATTFTGCSGGTGTMTTGNVIGGIGQDPRHPTEIWGSMPIWQWNNTLETGGIGQVTGKSVHDFIETDRDIFIEDDQPTKPTSTDTWLDSYTPLAYPHPLNDFAAAVASEATATTINAGTVTIGTN